MRIQEIMHSGRARRKSGPWLYGALAVTAIPIVCAQLAWSQGVPVAAKLTAAPVDSAVTSPFGMRPDPMGKGMKFHGGVDFAVPTGTPVHAPGDGKVGAVYSNAKDGKVLEIGYGGGLTTRMTHLDSTSVKWGDKVKTGDVVAMSGATGSVTGPHLHFEVRVKGKQVNPATMDTALAGSAQSQ